MTEKNIEQSISDSLETSSYMLPYIPYLLQDLWALGSSVEIILKVIEELRLPKTARILDLGCGKGAVSIQIASRFGFHVTGIDAMEPFLRDAIRKAEEFNVSNLCEFIKADILNYTLNKHNFDIVILASLGGVLGSLRNTIARLRMQVKNNGCIIIDDGYLKQSDHLNRKGYERCLNHKQTLDELISFGDILLKEINTDDVSLEINEEYTALIKKRGEELIASNPEMKDEINNYILTQEEECKFLDDEIGGAVWVLKKWKV
jgi:SAM-dependent methyltransferase